MWCMTHLHTDHVGWNTVQQDGKWVPTFPKAKYLFPKAEFDYWKAEYAKDKTVNQGSFEDSVLPIFDAGLARVHRRDEGRRRLPDTRAGAGPCAGHAFVPHPLARRGRPVLRRHPAQRDPDRAAGLERPLLLWPDKALESRAVGLKRACERGALLMPMHLGAPYCGYVRRQGDGYAFEPAT